MRLLLDTHLLLWAGFNHSRIPSTAVAMMEDLENQLVFSSASIWEIAIKRRLDKNSPLVEARIFRQNLLANDYEELPIHGLHAAQVQELPNLHKDPFDRILIAQALVEGLLLLTVDRTIARYPGPIRSV